MWYNNLSDYLKQKYNKKLYKLALDAGRTCPNRDGTCGNRGCIFCSGSGSGDFAANRQLPIGQQLAEAKERIQKKLPVEDVGYIAYFQAFTNTYGSVEELEPLFMEAIGDSEVEILSIATRPDCLQEDILDMLERLIRIKPVWVELGLQTMHPKTANYNLYYYLLLYICCDENTEEQSILWVKGIRYAYRNIILYFEYAPIIWDRLKLDLQRDFKTNLFYVNNDLHKNIKEEDIELRDKMLDIPTFCTIENIESVLRSYAKNDIVRAYVLNEAY